MFDFHQMAESGRIRTGRSGGRAAGLRLWAFLAALLLVLPLQGQYRTAPADSLRGSAFRPVQLIAPGALMAGGLCIHYFAHDSWDAAVRSRAQDIYAQHPVGGFEDYLQYVPLVMDLGLGFAPVEVKHGFWDRFIEAALAHAVCGIISGPAKLGFHTLRPNGVDFKSFPSGHTSFSFTGAALVGIEYGPWIGASAYLMAGSVGAMRIYHDWHWMSDVLMGAGIGILSAYAGSWLLEPTKKLLGIRTSGRKDIALLPAWQPASGSLCLMFGYSF